MKMRKWSMLLILALLLGCAAAEEDIYFTNSADRYYHLDENCDRPPETSWYDYVTIEYYQREIYQKTPISETAALEFGKIACPICVNVFQPVYLGEHAPQWNYEAEPWEINGLDPEDEQYIFENRPEEYSTEIIATNDAFEAYYEEIYNRETKQVERRHPYPAAYAGKYMNNSGSISYRVVNPDDEILASFKRMFGGGAWIVPAKYGYDEIMAARDRIILELQAWCEAHPDVDARWVSAGSPDYENYAVIEINGADWRQAAAAMEEAAPIYIHFTYGEAIEWVDF